MAASLPPRSWGWPVADDQRESDPLPYLQVDRSVLPAAGQLASLLGVTRQHALGALIEFWGLCARPRDLEKIVKDTPEGETPKVVVSAQTLELRFKLASGANVSTDALVELQLVEPQADGYRVRGLSRYFEAIQERLTSRRSAAKGGSRSSTQPRVGGRFTARSVESPSGHRAVTERTAERSPSKRTEDRGQRSEDRDQRTDTTTDLPTGLIRRPSLQEQVWEECCIARAVHLRALGLPEEDQQVAPQKVNTILARAASKLSTGVADLVPVWEQYLEWVDGANLDPPWPIEVFVSDRVLTMAADRHRREAAS